MIAVSGVRSSWATCATTLGLPAVHLLEMTILRFERGLLTPQVCLQRRTCAASWPRVGRLSEGARSLA